MLNIDFTGPNEDFFGDAFFAFSGGPAFDVTVTSSNSTQIVMEHATTGAITTFTGSDFVVNGAGVITGGTIAGIEFADKGSVVATFDGVSWDGAVFYSGLVEIGSTGKSDIYLSLINQQDVHYDAKDSIVKVDVGVPKNFTRKFSVDGSEFADSAFGGSFGDTLKGFDGGDVLNGKAGNDKLIGGRGKDVLLGGKGKDDLKGGQGVDSISGGKGGDNLTGGKAADKFLFNGTKNEGKDSITDFADGSDLICITGLTFGDLTISKTGGGSDTKILLSSGTEIVLFDVHRSTINADDFIFT